MKHIKLSMLWALLILCVGASDLSAQKMTAEEVLTKHLESIGSAKNREAIKSRIIVSDVEFLLQKQNPVNGKAVMASTNQGVIYGINLESSNLLPDKFSFDGKKTRVGYVSQGVRSLLGGFIISNPTVLKDGLLGGALSSSWGLLNIENRKPKLSYSGTEKIEKKETHIIEYQPKGGSDMTIKMYFDAETFRHVRSEYSVIIAARMGTGGVDDSARRVDTRYRLTEDFSKFERRGDLILPSVYKITYEVAGGAATNKAEWKFKVTDVSFNQPLGEAAFDIDAN